MRIYSDDFLLGFAASTRNLLKGLKTPEKVKTVQVMFEVFMSSVDLSSNSPGIQEQMSSLGREVATYTPRELNLLLGSR